jgi:hypothetical protein
MSCGFQTRKSLLLSSLQYVLFCSFSSRATTSLTSLGRAILLFAWRGERGAVGSFYQFGARSFVGGGHSLCVVMIIGVLRPRNRGAIILGTKGNLPRNGVPVDDLAGPGIFLNFPVCSAGPKRPPRPLVEIIRGAIPIVIKAKRHPSSMLVGTKRKASVEPAVAGLARRRSAAGFDLLLCQSKTQARIQGKSSATSSFRRYLLSTLLRSWLAGAFCSGCCCGFTGSANEIDSRWRVYSPSMLPKLFKNIVFFTSSARGVLFPFRPLGLPQHGEPECDFR